MSPAITHRLHQLERAGLVERVDDPQDGRGLLVGLSERGRRLVDEVAPLHLDNERRLLAGLAPDEQQQLAALLARLLAPFEQESPYPPPRPSRRGRRD